MMTIEAKLKAALIYDPETGEFTWIGSRHWKGKKAGTKSNQGYNRIWFLRRKWAAHRLAWLLHYGEWPSGYIDHINGDRFDNRITNLRVANVAENSRNQMASKRNKLGLKGVSKKQSGRYCATIHIRGKNHHLGTFPTAEDAAMAYNEAAIEHYGEFAYVNVL